MLEFMAGFEAGSFMAEPIGVMSAFFGLLFEKSVITESFAPFLIDLIDLVSAGASKKAFGFVATASYPAVSFFYD